MFRLVLKVGTTFSDTATLVPLRGFRPVRASRVLTANTPKSRSSTRSPCASAVVIVSKMALMIFSTSRWYRCGFSAAILSISSDLSIGASGGARSQARTGQATSTEAGGAMLKLSAQAVIVESDGGGAPDPSLVGGNGAFRQVQSTMTARSGREPAP